VDQPLERSAFAGFSSRLTAGLIDWLIVLAALWIAVIIQATQAGAMIAVALAFAALALIGHLWALFDPHRQSLQDRLFGLAVVHAKPQEEPTLATPVST
jgi:uncharacterized RDD family membrane protein YckC